MLRIFSRRGVTPIFPVAVLCLALTAPPLPAQMPSFAEREAMYLRYLELGTLIEGGSVEPHWMADGNSFWYAEGPPENTIIYKVDPERNTRTELFDTERLREVIAKALDHELPYQGLPFGRFSFEGHEERSVRFTVEGEEFVLDLGSYNIIRVEAPVLGESEGSRSTRQRGEILSPDGKWFGGADGYNLTLRSTTDERRVPLTTDGIGDYEWILGNWSPNGLQLVAGKVDRRHIRKYPIIHWLKSVPEVEWISSRDLMSTCEMSVGWDLDACSASMLPGPRLELYLVDIRSGQRVRVDTAGETILGGLQWLPDGTEFLFARRHPLRKRLQLMAADAATGATRVVVTETAETFLTNAGSPSAFPFLDGGKRFIWRSERDGWFHLYLYDIDGTLIRRLTEGPFEVSWPIVDEASGWIYFEAASDPEHPYYEHLHRVSLEGEGYTRLTERPGRLEGISPSMKYFVWTAETPTQPPVVELRRADGTLLQTLSRANIDRLVEELDWKPTEEFMVKAADGESDLHGLLYKPWDFDPSRRYPVVQVIYGNPTGTNTWTSGFVGNRRLREGRALAQMGFIVFLVEERGTRGRGKAFYDVVYDNLGRYQILDDVTTLEQLADERSYMDLSRVGVLGGSYGGYAATRAMLLAPDVYHVGVATSANFKKWNPWLMGSPPDENPEAYEYASNLTHVGNLKGKLLLAYGTSDVSVRFDQGMKLVEALTRAGKPYDLIIMPGVGHSPQGASRAYRNRRIVRYFVEHLKPEHGPEEEAASSAMSPPRDPPTLDSTNMPH